MRKFALILLSACALSCASAAFAQDDAPSLGDVARRTRQQKQQRETEAAKGAPSSSPTNDAGQATDPANAQPKVAKKVITNEEIPEHIGPTITAAPQQPNVSYPQKSGNQMAAEQVKSQIVQMKNYVASLQSQIANLEKSVQYTGGNCVYGCVQWNEHQQQKQEQAESLKQQLAQYQKNLEHTQEMARRQGYGSAVYDP
jgi:hypothetical protein